MTQRSPDSAVLLLRAHASLDPRVTKLSERLDQPDARAWVKRSLEAPGQTESIARFAEECVAHAEALVPGAADVGALQLAILEEALGLLLEHADLAPADRLKRALAAVAAHQAAAAPPDPRHSPKLNHVGNYELDTPIGNGASGVVFSARHRDNGLLAAVKLLRPDALSSEHVERFRREARFVAQLSHPAIVRLLDSGVVVRDGVSVPFLVSELVVGRPFCEVLAGQPVDVVLRAFATVCDAISHAHGRGVLHRDIKSSNVLVDADGIPHVLDFGIARSLGDEHGAGTRTGHILGTPGSMSPEHARGGRIDVRSDVWSLGALLFEALAGVLPHDLRGLSGFAAFRYVADHPPRSLSNVRSGFSRNLRAVVDKAIVFDPRDRYADVAALSMDVRRLLDGQAVVARPLGMLARLWRAGCRHRLVATAVGSIALAVIVTFAAVLWSARQQRRAKEVALHLNEVALRFAEALAETATPTVEQRRLLESSLAVMPKVDAEDRSDEALATLRGESGLRELLGDLLLRHEAWPVVREHRVRVLELQRQMARAGVGDVQAEARAIVKLGDLDRERQPAVARLAYETAHRLLTEAVAQNSASLSLRDDLGWSWERLAYLAMLQGRTEDADRLSSQRVRVAEALLADHPDSLRQYGLAQALLVRAQCIKSQGPAAILQLQQRACVAADAALAREPDRRPYLSLCWRAHSHLVETRLTLGTAADLHRELAPAFRAKTRLLQVEPGNAELHLSANSLHDLAARCAQAANRLDLVVEELQAAFDHAVACMRLRGNAADARVPAISAAARVRDWVSSIGGDPLPWQRQWQSLLAEAVSLPDATVAELVALSNCFRTRAGNVDEDIVRARELASRAARLAKPSDSIAVSSDLQQLLMQLGLNAELTDLRRRLPMK